MRFATADLDLSRRSFLASSAAAAAATAVPLPWPARARARGDEVIRVGLVGCGGRGTGAAAQALRTAGPVELVAMGDALEDHVAKSLAGLRQDDALASRVKVAPERCFVGFDACQRVLDAGVDVVILATPPHFRPDQFEAAVKKGVHVFMEKPVAVDGAGVRKVLAAGGVAEAKGLTVGVGLQRHHQDGYREAIARVHEGAIGEIVCARAYWNMGSLWHKEREASWSDMEWQLRNWLYFTWLSGDHIVEQHIHNLDVVNWAKRAFPVRAAGMGGRQVRTEPRFGHIYDHHAVEFEYQDGTFLWSQCRQIPGCANAVSEHLVGTEGRCDLDTDSWRITGKRGWKFEGKKRDPFQVEHDDLFAAIRAGKPYTEVEYGALSTLTAVMGRMATYTGKVVTREQALASERLGPESYEWGPLPVPPVAMPGLG